MSRFSPWFVALLILIPALLSSDAATSLGQDDPTADSAVRTSIDLVVVPEGESWLLALAAPVVEKLARDQNGHRPILLVTPRAPKPDKLATLNGVPWRHTLALHRGSGPLVPGDAEKRRTTWMQVPDTPAAASLALAERFWTTWDAVYIASTQDPGAAVQAATLAAHQARPLLLHAGSLKAIDDELMRRKPAKAFAIRSLASPEPDWRIRLAFPTTPLTTGETIALIQGRLPMKQAGTLLLARIPDAEPDSGPLAWLAPHWSAVRRAPVVLVRSPEPLKAETAVHRHIEQFRIAPRTLTILASSYSIDLEEFSISTGSTEQDAGYRFLIEPCSFPRSAGAALLGVGRIPALTLGEASLIFAGGRLREMLPAGRSLTIANPAHDDDGPLPLCETVSRATASELRNARLAVDEFNRKTTEDPRIMKAVKTARFILFQGHSIDNQLFPDPTLESVLPLQDEFAAAAPDDGEPPAPRAPPAMPHLEGRPIVFLQSCSSLQEGMADRIFAAGAPALIGSVTSIHSASGSTFAKALIDGALYRGATIGEALRDARNYYLTMIELKNRRGHTQQAKALRVAMSFRLWGDPELELVPGKRKKPLLPTVTARWTGEGQMKVSVPEERLPESRTETYRIHLLPGSETAGLVKRIPDSEVRVLMPFYFFRVALPKGFREKNYTIVRRSGGKPNRGAFFHDRLGRYLYIVYLPSKEKPGERFTLRFE